MSRAAWFLLAVVLGSCPTIATPLPAQSAPPGALAWTECLGGRVSTYVDVEVLGTDSTNEILHHEAIHRRQADDSIAKNGVCPVTKTAGQALTWEIEAYCGSDSVRVADRRATAAEARVLTLMRLVRQFHGAMSVQTIIDSWRVGCPEGR